MKILVAEDERITRRSLERQLVKSGHEVVTAEDGEEAWEQYQSQPFDIVVTDWEMPRCDGRELIDRIRGAQRSGYVYVIMLTSRSEKSDIVAGMESGADDFLAKPFDREELRVRLDAGERIIRLERDLAARNAALANANDRMKRDLDAAAEVQRDLLPRAMPDTQTSRFAWHFQPCDELGGDILNVISLDERYIAMYLLDVTGHGVPAALLSITLSRVLNTRDPNASLLIASNANGGGPLITTPNEVLERLNRQYPMRAQGGRFFTMVYAVLDAETGELQYALAGQPPPVLARPGQPPRHLEGSGFPIGVVDDTDFDSYSVQLQRGDRLYFYSDGITEATNRDGDMLGTGGLDGLIEASRELPLHDSVDGCIDALRKWSDPVPFGDDVSLLAMEIPDASS